MYENVAVDGSTSCIPGEQIEEDDEEGGNDDADVRYQFNPPSNTRTKGQNSTSTCATSPRKKSNIPMPKIMKGIWGTMEDHSNIVRNATHGKVLSETIKKAMRLVVECGAPVGSKEHFMAGQLFVEPVHREVFFTLKNNAERLTWLKMWCQKENMY